MILQAMEKLIENKEKEIQELEKEIELLKQEWSPEFKCGKCRRDYKGGWCPDCVNKEVDKQKQETKEMIEKVKEQISDRIWKDITLADKTKHPEKMDNLHNDIMNLIDDVSKK